MTLFFGQKLKLTQNGIIQNYLLGGVIGMLLLIILYQNF